MSSTEKNPESKMSSTEKIPESKKPSTEKIPESKKPSTEKIPESKMSSTEKNPESKKSSTEKIPESKQSSTEKIPASRRSSRNTRKSQTSNSLANSSAPSIADLSATTDIFAENVSDDDDSVKPKKTKKREVKSGRRGAAGKVTAKPEPKIKQTPIKEKLVKLPIDPDNTVSKGATEAEQNADNNNVVKENGDGGNFVEEDCVEENDFEELDFLQNDNGEFDLDSDDNTWGSLPKVVTASGQKVTHQNGRNEGRHLVLWHKPRMMEKLLLHLLYESQRAGIELPWDKVAHRLRPGTSHEAPTQYLAKVRNHLITEGHLVPPPVDKRVTVSNSKLRGYIRDLTKDDPHATRPVGWSEHIEDLAENLTIPGVYRGSGTYRKYVKTPRGRKRAAETNGSPVDKKRARGTNKTQMQSKTPKSGVKKGASSLVRANEASENEWAGESDEDDFYEETPCKKRRAPGLKTMTPPSNFPVILRLSPELLSKFPPGSSRAVGLSLLVEDDDEGKSNWRYPGTGNEEELLGMMLHDEGCHGFGYMEQTYQDQFVNNAPQMTPYTGRGTGDLSDGRSMANSSLDIGEFGMRNDGLLNYQYPLGNLIQDQESFFTPGYEQASEFMGRYDDGMDVSDQFGGSEQLSIGGFEASRSDRFGGSEQLNIGGFEASSNSIMSMGFPQYGAENFSAGTATEFSGSFTPTQNIVAGPPTVETPIPTSPTINDIDWDNWTTGLGFPKDDMERD